VPFTDFLKATVFISAAAATALGAVTGIAAGHDGNSLVVLLAVGWWVAAGLVGLWLGRRHAVNPPIGRLLAAARMTATLPEVAPGRLLLNRLWPLLLSTVGAGAVAFAYPQVPGIATGFAIIWALSWRRQEAAVTAIEERDGVRFFVERTRLWEPIRLVRTPGFKATRFEIDEAVRIRTRAQAP
jgi:hypothetical protein